MADYEVNSIWDAVERVARGAIPTPAEQDAFSWLQSTFGLKRSPEQYAGRTRRRYRAAAKRGESAAQVNKREYQHRKLVKASRQTKEQTMTKLQAHRKWDAIMDAMDYRNSFFRQQSQFERIDDDQVAEAVLCYGYDTVLERLYEEIESTKQYIAGRPEKGREEWYGSRTMQPEGTVRMQPSESPFADEFGELPDLSGPAIVEFGNVFYLYHGTMNRR